MTQKIKKPVSILLVFMMIVSLFAIVPITAHAAPTSCPYCSSTRIMEFGIGTYRCMNCRQTFTASTIVTTYTITFDSSLVNHTDVAAVELSSDYFEEEGNAQADTAYPYTSSSSFGGMQRIEFDVAINSQDFEPGAVTFTAGETTLSMYDVDNEIGDDNAAVSYNTIGMENSDSFYGYHYTVYTTDITDDITVSYSPTPKYTVTWKNGDTTLETDTVREGTTPTYDGETPTKDGVTFAGWTDSHGVFYAKDAALPEVTADETYTAVFELTIGSVDEWNSFAASVKGGNTYSGIIVRMTADVGPVTTMVDGTFSGTFDGDGHTLTVNISGGSTSAATFANVKDATIQNLRLEGTVTSSGIHTAALVRSISDNGSTCTIKNVDIYADVNCSQGYIGGFIGHAGVANTVNIENSIFAGSINKTGSTVGFIGAYIGWSQKLTATINNCAFTGSYNNINSFNNIGFSYNAPTKVTVSGFYSNASEVFVANVNRGTRLYVPSSSYPTTVALVKNNDGETFYSAFSDALDAWTDGSTLALLADVTNDSQITVPAADSKTLDLNGCALTIDGGNPKIAVSGTLTIQSTTSGGSISVTNKSRVINVVDGGTLNIESGTINGYNADRAVIGGVGTINLNGGKIATPASNAFSLDGDTTLYLNAGEVECTSSSTNMGTASAVLAHGDSTINWNGTAITTNTGDGIRMKSAGNGTVNVTGGSFTATSSSLPEEGGYAIYCNSNMGTLNLEGNPSISGRGIYLADDKVINITNDLSNTNPISVTMQPPGVFTSGLSGNGDASNFANGNGTGYALTLNASGEAQIVPTYTITWKNYDDTEIGTSTVNAGETPAFSDTIGEIKAKPDDDTYTYTFSGWTPEITAVTGDTTYTATFTETAKHVHEWDYDNPVWGEPIDDGTWQYDYNVNVTLTCKGDATHTKTLTATSGIVEEKEASCGEGGYKESVFSVTDEGHELSKRIRWAEEPANGEHQFYVEHAAVAPTVDSVGYEAYYECAECGKLFSDEEMTHEISAPVEIPKLKKLFPQHSVSLGGDIGVNFYINPAAADADEHAAVSVSFSWNGQTKTVTAVYDEDKKLFKATCNVVAAEVACDITAVATVNSVVQTQTDTYSVQDYAEAVYNNPAAYDNKGKPDELKELAKALLNYGAMAQTVFVEYMVQPVKAPADIVKTVGKTNFNTISADDIAGDATDLNAIATDLGFKYYTSSVLYLQNNTLRLYFIPNTYPGEMPHEGDFKGNQSKYYYYVEKEKIAAAELDDQQTFTIGGKEFTFSALDYAKAVVNSDMGGDQKNLAKSLYLYNQAANAYFD